MKIVRTRNACWVYTGKAKPKTCGVINVGHKKQHVLTGYACVYPAYKVWTCRARTQHFDARKSAPSPLPLTSIVLDFFFMPRHSRQAYKWSLTTTFLLRRTEREPKTFNGMNVGHKKKHVLTGYVFACILPTKHGPVRYARSTAMRESLHHLGLR